MSDLRNKLIKLGSENPELRPHLRKVLSSLEKEALDPLHEEYAAQYFPAFQYKLTGRRHITLNSPLIEIVLDGDDRGWQATARSHRKLFDQYFKGRHNGFAEALDELRSVLKDYCRSCAKGIN